MPDLGEAMIRAGAEAIQGAAYGPASKRKARLVIAAALRVYAEYCYVGDGGQKLYGYTPIIDLADAIEQPAEDGAT